jgi:hypothetical protein
VASATSYIRCDDETAIGEILAGRASSALGLRRLAPTVLVSTATADVVLERLRQEGLAPALETADGVVIPAGPSGRRTSVRRRPVTVAGAPVAMNETLLVSAVRAIRAGDRALTVRRRDADAAHAAPERPARRSTADVLALLAEALDSGQPLWMGYVNADGQASQRVVEPIGLEGGYLTAFDHRRNEVRTFSVHRITGLSPIDEVDGG